MTTPLYSIGTWDTELQAFTPQNGLTVASLNIDRGTLRKAMRELQAKGYSCHRSGDDCDPSVNVERTDGKPEAEILKDWERQGHINVERITIQTDEHGELEVYVDDDGDVCISDSNGEIDITLRPQEAVELAQALKKRA